MQKQNSNIRNETAEIANFYSSHCHSNRSSYLTGTKNIQEQKQFLCRG